MQISDTKIQEMFMQAVKAKVAHSTSLGSKASWTMKDHLDVAAKVIVAVVEDEVDLQQIRDAVQKTYNHSAFAQKLEKAFKQFGHFQRDSRKVETFDDVWAKLAQESAGAKGTEAAPSAPTGEAPTA